MRTVLRVALWLGGLAAAQLAPPAAAQVPSGTDKGYVCWLDDRGVRVCGDHVPPEYAKRQREIYDKRGLLLRTLKAEESPEQHAEEQRQAVEAQRQQEDQLKREANDKYVLDTYTSLSDLKAARDNRLAAYDMRLDLAEKSVHAGEASLKDLQGRAEVERNAGRDPSPELDAQIKSFATAQSENINAMARISQEREAVAAQFQHYIELFQQAHGITPLPPATPLAPQPPEAPPPQPAPQP
jgi:hypothetical protein